MSARKLSVSMDEGIAEAVAASAKRQGQSLSSWLSDAAARALKIEEGLAAVAEWEAEHGAITEEEMAKAKAIFEGKQEVHH